MSLNMSKIVTLLILSGADPGILVRGGVDFFFKGNGFGGHLKAGPQWVQGNALVGAQGGEAPGSS